ncbi:MAG: sulfite exporter TauE/SafE family protein [Magnetovibrionaceae bacterium]
MTDPSTLELTTILSFAAALMAAGAIAGLIAGLLGVGGGIVIVPVLYVLFPYMGISDSVIMHLAVGTSLATIIATSITSSRTHYKKGGLNITIMKMLSPSIIVGVILGSVLGGKAEGEVLILIFAILALLVALNMAFDLQTKIFGKGSAGEDGSDLRLSELGRHISGLCIGGFSVVMGIGGGSLSVPFLTAKGVPIRIAVGTAAGLGLVIAVPGTIGFMAAGWGHPDLPPFSLGYVNLLGFALIVPTSMLTAPIGARITHAIDPLWLKYAFATFLCFTSMRMFYGLLT